VALVAVLAAVCLLGRAAAGEPKPPASGVQPRDVPTSDVRLSKPERLAGGVQRFTITTVNCLEATVVISGQLEGYTPSHPLPWTFVLSDKSQAFDLTPAPSEGDSRFEISFRWRPGPMGATPDPAAIYRLPYPPGQRWMVSQGNFGRFSHDAGSGNEYSVDWAMPSGSPVCAARSGTVLAIKQDSEIGGSGRRFDAAANYIQIKHADGTCGEYVHLEAGGAAVRVGQHVEAGELIGRSGNTGNSTEPHLHFGVFINRDAITRAAIPIRWQTRRGVTDRLIEGRLY
jgi:murein DD-endopeptidase MepM/ murein hydrolase activator NlpD